MVLLNFLLFLYKFYLHLEQHRSTTNHFTHNRMRKFMSAKYHQMSLKEVFYDCQGLCTDDAPSFFQLLNQHLDLDAFIPVSFSNAFYRSLGRKRLYPPASFLSALIPQKIFSIPTDWIIHHITFLDDDFKQAHPEMPVEKKSDFPDEDKSIDDSSSLKPVSAF